MEGKIKLYDANGTEFGETFMRRARQLVKQQRADWIDEAQTAIRFYPDFEAWETHVEKSETPTEKSEDTPDDKNDLLVAIAKKRLRERWLFKLHSIALVPVSIVILFAWIGMHEMGVVTDGIAFISLGFNNGVWITLYFVHLYFYYVRHIKGTPSRKQRRERQLAAEIERLKVTGF